MRGAGREGEMEGGGREVEKGRRPDRARESERLVWESKKEKESSGPATWQRTL